MSWKFFEEILKRELNVSDDTFRNKLKINDIRINYQKEIILEFSSVEEKENENYEEELQAYKIANEIYQKELEKYNIFVAQKNKKKYETLLRNAEKELEKIKNLISKNEKANRTKKANASS